MKDGQKTALFMILAIVVLGVAWASQPAPINTKLDDVVNRPVAPDFKDPLAAKSMEIIDFDDKTGAARAFKVAQQGGVWSLPSHFGYPADAERQLAEAAAGMMDLKILSVQDQNAADHAKYGVIDPATAEPGSKGIGKHITLADQGGKKLLDIIIGNEIKGQPDQRYVRIAGKDPVYVITINTQGFGKLSTRFDDWIEKDLLKLNAWDMQGVTLNNYSVDEVQGKVNDGDVLDLTYSDKDAKWSLTDLKEGEELDQTKLNDMKTALDDLKIVDVRKKPAGLSAELRKIEGVELDQQSMRSLAGHGFYLTRDGNLLSNEGEAVVRMKDGVEYALRFGEIATGTEAARDEETAKDGEKKEEADAKKPAEKGQNRYLFVTARFDRDLIAAPELQQLPEEPATNGTDEAKPASEEPAAETPATEPAAEQPAEKPAEGTKPAAKPQASLDAALQDAICQEDDAKKADEGEKKDGDKQDEAAAAEAQAPALSPEQITQIKAENKRKQDDYDAKVKKAEERVKELNDRFADWYYVISDDVYRKIHLSRADIMKKPEPEQPPIGGPLSEIPSKNQPAVPVQEPAAP